MKEITRIHIAKVAYDIELEAKKDIEEYMRALERFASDAEILGDIEIRITELLNERGVAAGGVITKDDVAAVRERLGEPSDFASDAGEPGGNVADAIADEPRRVYRDESTAVLGGVLSGLAKYTGVDVIWVRLLFIVVLLGSFGSALILYAVLWLIIPPARTAAEKLQMSGKPVTLATIKEASRRAEPAVSESMRVVRAGLRIGVGMILLLGAVGSLLAIAVATGIPFGAGVASVNGMHFDQWWMPTAFGLFALAGVLLAALFSLLAVATFRKHWSGRLSVVTVVLIVFGLLSFFGGAGTLWYGQNEADMRINALMRESRDSLPSAMNTVKNLKVDLDGNVYSDVWVNYLVSDTPRWQLTALSGLEPQFTFSEDGETATLKVVRSGGDQNTMRRYGNAAPAILNLYGPALASFDARYVEISSYTNEGTQDELRQVLRDTNFSLGEGTYDDVSLMEEGRAKISPENATINSLSVDSKGGLVEAAVVRSLAVTQPEACSSQEIDKSWNAAVIIEGISSGNLVYNGKEQPAKTVISDCGRVIIGDEDNREGEKL